jgi:hypothetical protein
VLDYDDDVSNPPKKFAGLDFLKLMGLCTRYVLVWLRQDDAETVCV